MIKKIVIRDVASYDHNGVAFADLQKVNFIYGGNGTGKTTLSRVLSDDKQSDEYPQCQIEWEGNRRKEVLVYNQDFKKKNLTEVMPGIFMFGENALNRSIKEKKYRSRLRQLEEKGYDDKTIYAKLNHQYLDYEEENSWYNVEQSMYEINQSLKQIGFTGFRIAQSSNPYTYEIVRQKGEKGGQTLSEGEATILTFLYFFQTLKGIAGSYSRNGKKVVVIDDPISSLDYATIEVVSTITNIIMKAARYDRSIIEQVFLLTHNTTYYQSLYTQQPKDDTKYWKLYKKKEVSQVIDYGTENQVIGDYAELWKKLREANENNNIIVMPNLMRRIVETYFVDYGGFEKNKLFAGVYTDGKEDKQAVVSFAKWLDEGSHAIIDNVYAGNEEGMCDKYMEAFRMLFEKMGQLGHYCMMMKEEL